MQKISRPNLCGRKYDRGWDTLPNERPLSNTFVGLAYQGKDVVFRFIIEYSSLRDFGPQVLDLFLYEDFQKMTFWLVFKLEISYRVMLS